MPSVNGIPGSPMRTVPKENPGFSRSRRNFIKWTVLTAAGLAVGGGATTAIVSNWDGIRGCAESTGVIEPVTDKFIKDPWAIPGSLYEYRKYVELNLKRRYISDAAQKIPIDYAYWEFLGDVPGLQKHLTSPGKTVFGIGPIRDLLQAKIDHAKKTGKPLIILFGEQHWSKEQLTCLVSDRGLFHSLAGVDFLSLEFPGNPGRISLPDQMIYSEAGNVLRSTGGDPEEVRLAYDGKGMPNMRAYVKEFGIQGILNAYRKTPEAYSLIEVYAKTNTTGDIIRNYGRWDGFAKLFTVGKERGWPTYVADLTEDEREKASSLLCCGKTAKIIFDIRNIRMAKMVNNLATFKGQPRIVIHYGGNLHLQRFGLPQFIREDADLLVVSLIGGRMHDYNKMLYAAHKLGWDQKTFAILMHGNYLADITIHVPTEYPGDTPPADFILYDMEY